MSNESQLEAGNTADKTEPYTSHHLEEIYSRQILSVSFCTCSKNLSA